mmetsp:Transcript_8505/g.17631  ORF Transcript_8505/g.17631 Transcript_8505/m.17631 type:complete len:255 (+) Transcript_8505:201-965(+)|eukprot:CAMPEP_0118935540 /NCGR_PEP_ID=MMETSP1169-20130426/15698_1 /TAXON_ID=36882 /ORGANISM="Pyramimonas obovata, Strain CCMP722" /LENGTH=254 /DNA_ID=CAMNT_0006878591 /DNA_START=201 /DNA_END=965 /DNA_ORIENTATION=+
MKFPKPIFEDPLILGPEWLTDMHPFFQALIGLGMGALLAILLALFKFFTGSKRGNAFLVLGPCGAGKTSLFLQLFKGNLQRGTVTSQQPNEATFALPGTKGPTVNMVDMPGHSRLRSLVDKRLPSARAIIFMVDAVDFMPTARTTADLLYDLLSKRSVQQSKVPVLVACNKTEVTSAHTIDFIRKRLEKELDQLRGTRAAMQDTTKSGSEELSIGKPGQPFTFAQCRNLVTFDGVSVAHNELGPVFEFIRTNNK